MYKIIGISLLILLALIIVPVSSENPSEAPLLYGAVTLVASDINGNIVLKNTVHNRIVNAGEDYVADMVFRDTVAPEGNDGDGIGAICLYVAGGAADTDFDTVAEIDVEGVTATNFDQGNNVGNTECQVDTADTTGAGTAVLLPEAFTGGTHTTADQSVEAIAVCQTINTKNDNDDFSNCATDGVIFAVVDTTNVVLANGETVTVTYTFDVSSADT